MFHAPGLVQPLIGKRDLVAGVHRSSAFSVGFEVETQSESFITDQNMLPAHHLQRKYEFCIVEKLKLFGVAQGLGDFR